MNCGLLSLMEVFFRLDRFLAILVAVLATSRSDSNVLVLICV